MGLRRIGVLPPNAARRKVTMQVLAARPRLSYARLLMTADTPPAPRAPTDDVLLRRFRDAGEEDALAALIARHWERAWRLAWCIVRDPAVAEDAAQQAFVKVAAGAKGYEDEGRFDGW